MAASDRGNLRAETNRGSSRPGKLLVVEGAGFSHALQDPVSTRPRFFPMKLASIAIGSFDHGRKERRICASELRGLLAEIHASGSPDASDADA